MLVKSGRGVQQNDVWVTADALVIEGLRPTIERVRQKMGRGSPNTVGPLLESWFATLGPRLGIAKVQEEGGGLPVAVQQASAKLWEVAMSQSRKEVEMSAAADSQALAEERAIFESRVTELAQLEAVFAERQVAAQRALNVAQNQIADLGARLQDIQAVLAQRDQDIQGMLSKLAEVEQQRDAERLRAEAENQRLSKERNKTEERASAHERRLLQEIDRERQEAKAARAAVSAIEQRVEDASKQVEQNKQQLTEQLLHANEQLRSHRQALTASQERAAELRALLDAQAIAGAVTLKQLELLMANTPPKRFFNVAKQARTPKRNAAPRTEKSET